MRVLLDTTYAVRAPRSGTAIYIRRLIGALQDAGVELMQAFDQRRGAPAGGGFGSLRNLARDQWWLGLELPRLARRSRAELIHHPLPARSRGAPVAQVITVHDLAFERLPGHFDARFRAYAHQTHRAAALAAGAVIAVSDTTAADARAFWGVSAERLIVARHGPGQQLDAVSGRERTHFLYVGDEEPRKDLPTLLAAYQRYRSAAARPLELVLAGSACAGGDGIRLEREPEPARLAELYAGAVALVHPSLYEGFGLTVAEAMNLGTPVLAARTPAILELCGDAVLYADPGDAKGLAAAMDELALGAALREDLSRRGRERAATLSWAACAHAHRAAYSLALETR